MSSSTPATPSRSGMLALSLSDLEMRSLDRFDPFTGWSAHFDRYDEVRKRRESRAERRTAPRRGATLRGMTSRKTLYLANPYGFSAQQRGGPLTALVAALEAMGADLEMRSLDRFDPFTGWSAHFDRYDEVRKRHGQRGGQRHGAVLRCAA